MNKYALYHKCESNYCFPTSKDELVIRFRISNADDVTSVFIVYGCKYDFYAIQHEKEMKIRYNDELFRYYEIKLKLDDVRVTYVFKIISEGKTYYFSEDGLSNTYDFNYNFYNCFQYSYIHTSDIHKEIAFMKNAIIYEIFVDRFKIGNYKKDMLYINMAWNEKPTPKSFAGGDLQGVIDSLDYFKELGINVLYLTPIFKSKSNHKYDIEDYYKIDEQFGDEKTLTDLITKAHQRGIRVLLDAVFNHISEDSFLFKDVKEKGKKSKYYNWFIFKDDDYECFSICKYMPKLNSDNEEVQDYLIQIGKYYIEKFNIDGWRLDVSDEVSHKFWKKFRTEIKKVNENAVLIGENWHDANKYLQGDEFDSIMNYAFTKALLDYLAFNKYNSKMMSDKLNELLMRNTISINNMMLNLIDSHDTHRFYTEINKDIDKYLVALALLYFYSGAPCLYYGDESLMEGGYDPDSRRGFVENKDNLAYELLLKLKTLKNDELFNDSELYIWYSKDLLILDRINNISCFRLVINNGNEVVYKTKNIIASNKYSHSYLYKYGFVIERRDSEK